MESWYLWLVVLFIMLALSPSVMGGILFAVVAIFILTLVLVIKSGPALVEFLQGLNDETKQNIIRFIDDLKNSNKESEE